MHIYIDVNTTCDEVQRLHMLEEHQCILRICDRNLTTPMSFQNHGNSFFLNDLYHDDMRAHMLHNLYI